MATISGFRLDTFPHEWLVSEPEDNPHLLNPHTQTFFNKVIEYQSGAGIGITGHQGGFFKFNFHGFAPAISQNTEEHHSFEEAVRVASERVLVMNSFCFCLHSGRLKSDLFDSATTLVSTKDIVNFREDGSGFGGDGMSKLPLMNSAPEFYTGVISRASCEQAFSLLDKMLRFNEQGAVQLSALLNESVAAYKQHNYSLAVSTSWTVCEVLISRIWSDYISTDPATGQARSLNRERRENLQNSRDFTASTIAEVLNLAGRLPEDTFKKLRDVRKNRNSWLHSMKRPSRETAFLGVSTAAELLGEMIGDTLPVGGSLQVSG